MGGRVWRDSVEVPHISQCEDVSGYSADQINGWIAQLKGPPGAWEGLFTAAQAWTAAGEKLEGLKGQINEVAELLESAWSSEDSVACQQALQRLHNTAGGMAETSRDISSFTHAAGETLQGAVGNFDTGDGGGGPGFFEQAGGVLGGPTPIGRDIGSGLGSGMDSAIDTGLDALGNPFGLGGGPSPDEKAREALSALNTQYQADNTRLPQQVSAELPVLADPGSDFTPMEPPSGYTPAPPPTGTDVPGTPPTGPGPSVPGTPDGPGSVEHIPTTPVPGGPGTDVPAVPGGPDSGVPGYDPNPGYDDGVTGGLAGTGGGFTSPGGAPGTGVGGGIGTSGGAGTGVSGGGIGAGGAAGAGAGVAAVGGTRGIGGGMVPMGAGTRGSGGSGGRTGTAGARGTGGGAVRGPLAGGRAGAAGGMVPMGAGRGSGGKDDGRETWLVEDDDPWGTETETPPGVIR